MDVVDALGVRRGTTCLVGAGGKKTTMATLAAHLDPVVLTATVRIPIFDPWVEAVLVTDDPVAAVREAAATRVGVVPERERADRYRGYDPAIVDELTDAIESPVVVKADGARSRLLKAPDDHEPRIPATADTVVPVASVHAVGRPLTDEHVHRVERVAAVTGREPGDPLTVQDVARVVASPDGGLRDVPPEATPVPLLNMVDDAGLEATAREVAERVHDLADVPRVVLAEMRADAPLVATV